MRQVEQIMGMPITVDIPGCDNGQVFKNTYGRLREIDRRFSPYKKNSELSKYQRGELSDDDLSAEFKKIMSACKAAEEQTVPSPQAATTNAATILLILKPENTPELT
jgi:thiamine biosynthesis lipoprotein